MSGFLSSSGGGGATGATGATGAAGPTSALYGTYASRPAAGTSGRIYTCSDGPTQFIDDGSNWRPLIKGAIGKQIPAMASWTSTYGASITYTDAQGTVTANDLVGTGTKNCAGLAIAKPATLTATLHVRAGQWDNSAAQPSAAGIVIYDTGTSKCAAIRLSPGTAQGGGLVEVVRRVNFSGGTLFLDYQAQGSFGDFNDVWLRVQDDGVNFLWSASDDGKQWIQIFSSVRAAYVPSAGNRIGIYSQNDGPIQATFDSWEII